MRYWDRAKDPNKPESRSRSTVQPVLSPVPSQFGQRPMFSVPGEDQPPPDQSMMGTESRLDPVVPEDNSQGSKSRTVLDTPNPRAGITFTFSTDNVSATPTDAELRLAFSGRPAGWSGILIDAGGVGTVYLCVKSQGDTWWYEALTKAT